MTEDTLPRPISARLAGLSGKPLPSFDVSSNFALSPFQCAPLTLVGVTASYHLAEPGPAAWIEVFVQPATSSPVRGRFFEWKETLSRLPSPDEAPSQRAVNRAALLLEDLEYIAGSRGIQFSEPNASVDSEGQILLEWWVGDRKLSIYVSEDVAEHMRIGGAALDSPIEEGLVECEDDLLELWRWLESPSP